MNDSTPSPNGDNGRDDAGKFAVGNRFGRGNPRAAVANKLRAALDAAITPADVQKAVGVIRFLMRNNDERSNVRLAAAVEILDRAVGKAAQGDLAERLEQLEALVEQLEQNQ